MTAATCPTNRSLKRSRREPNRIAEQNARTPKGTSSRTGESEEGTGRPRTNSSKAIPRISSDSTFASCSSSSSTSSFGVSESRDLSALSKVRSSCSLTTTPDQDQGLKVDPKTVLQALEEHEVQMLSTLGNALESITKGKVYNASIHSPISLCFVGKARISLIDYLSRVTKYINQLKVSASDDVSPGMRALVMAVLYTDRISKRHPDFVVMTANIHRLYLTAMMTATKVTEDVPMNAAFWAKVGGISSRELINLENNFLKAIDYDLRVEAEEFWLYQKRFAAFSDLAANTPQPQ